MKPDLKRLGEIYLSFFKLGSVSFGGGYSMIPLIEREVVENKKWVDRERIVDIFAVAGSLPGAIAINASTFVGYSVSGLAGAIAAFLGNITPSVIIVLALSDLFTRFGGYAPVRAAFQAIYPVIVGLILYAAFKIGQTAVTDKFGISLVIAAFLASLIFHLDPVTVTVAGALAGVAATTLKNTNNKKVRDLLNSLKGRRL